ncbi:hypothetical protein HMPREF1423_00573 [Helicobacter pylori GAM270ASi]|nr:hypothetical protein HMPREF1423_00573 [Helicobacter pylori GAM270ASi]
MTQRIELNTAEKNPTSQGKGYPWEGIQLMHKTQLTPLISFLPPLKSHQPPLYSD